MHKPSFSNAERIWQVVALIPPGKISSYGVIADLAGLPGRARYVSRALKLANDELNLPWHRVLNSQGRIAFDKQTEAFAEQMMLLRLEGVDVKNGRVDKTQYMWQPDMATLVMQLSF
ncbi:MGMT family protein [Shewanella waksmanii]|uniref:MGMT family protein n=1 Tax=Shewanella waksmanii TaxID=213783 RepID=UPI00373606F7